MTARGRGGIINIASNSAFQPLPYMATYAASKAFVLHFGEALQHELSPTGVRVTTACPGPTATSFFEGTPTTMSDRSFDTPEMVVRGTHPTLVINGSNDVIIYIVNSFILQQNLPDAQLILYPDSNHGSQYQYPALFVADVTRFLDAAVPFPTQKDTDHG
jgi:short-subunit dehydrogenase